MGTLFAVQFEKVCIAEGLHVYSTMSATKAEFAGGKIRSLENVLYCYMEDHWLKYIQKLTHFVLNLFSKKMLDGLDCKKCQDFRLFVHSVQQATTRNLGKLSFLKYILPCRKVYAPQFTQKVFILLQFLPNKLQHTQSRMNRKRFFVVYSIKKSWSKSFNKCFVYIWLSSYCIFTANPRQYTQLFHTLFAGETEPWRATGDCNFETIPHINVPNCYRGDFRAF